MLTKRPNSIALVEFLSAPETVTMLLEQHFNGEPDSKALFYAISSNHPTDLYLHIEDGFAFLKKKFDFDFFEVCNYLAERHFEMSDSYKVFLRDRYLDELMIVKSQLDNFLLEAVFLSRQSMRSGMDENQQRAFFKYNTQYDYYTHHSVVEQIPSFADLHVHLWSSVRIEYRLHRWLVGSLKVDDSRLTDDLFVHLNEAFYPVRFWILAFRSLENALVLKNAASLRKLMKQILLHDYSEIEVSLAREKSLLRQSRYVQNKHHLLHKAHYFFTHNNVLIGDRYVMLYMTHLLHKVDSDDERMAATLYLVIRNILKKYMVQQHRRSGLGYFSTYSRNSLRGYREDVYLKDLLHSIFSTTSDKEVLIEGRIKPHEKGDDLRSEVENIIRTFMDNVDRGSSHAALKLTMHFQKKSDKECPHKPPAMLCLRFESFKKEIKTQTLTLIDFLKKSTSPVVMRDGFQSDRLNLAEYISAIDAAGKEYLTPPYVFAGVFRHVRNTIELSVARHRPIKGSESVQPLHLKRTFHVGEDFRDLLSGVRSVFEAVLFLNLTENDRIGHGIALGLDAGLFYAKVPSVMMSNEEYMDNLVFAYYVLDRLESGEFVEEKRFMRQMIMTLGRTIYNSDSAFKAVVIDDFVDAWFLRRNCHVELKRIGDTVDMDCLALLEKENLWDYYPLIAAFQDAEYVKTVLPDFFESDINEYDIFAQRYFQARRNSTAKKLYWAFMTDRRVRNIGQEMFDRYIQNMPSLVTFLQDAILEKMIAKRHIAIEVMPTSNLLISHISSIKEHPMFKFRPVIDDGGPKIRTYICSDNPMIQNTNIFKEYDYLYTYLKKEYGKERAVAYLTEMAEASKKEFER